MVHPTPPPWPPSLPATRNGVRKHHIGIYNQFISMWENPLVYANYLIISNLTTHFAFPQMTPDPPQPRWHIRSLVSNTRKKDGEISQYLCGKTLHISNVFPRVVQRRPDPWSRDTALKDLPPSHDTPSPPPWTPLPCRPQSTLLLSSSGGKKTNTYP